jgi:hypothetical protein
LLGPHTERVEKLSYVT